MTQQQINPYAAPQQQPYPQQGYAPPAPPVAPYPQQVQQPAYPPMQPGYPSPYGFPVPPAPPQQPLAQGTLDDFYNQPSGGGGKSISWQNKPEGTVYAGYVARDVNNGDVKQQTDFVTKAPLTYGDGRPKFTMTVPLKVQPSQEFPEGEASWYVKGQARDELQRAMSESGVSGAPREGAYVEVRLVQRKPSSRGLNPANVFAVRYVPGDGAGASSLAPAPVSQPAPPQQQLVGQGQPVYAPQGQQPGYPPQGQQQPAVNQAPPQGYAPQQPMFQQPQQAAAPPVPPPPAAMSEHQQQLMAQLGAAQGQPQQ